jgi:hypothetical protein
VKPEIAIAQLSIVDGAWQESPDNVAQFEESALFEGTASRGNLYLVTEVTGDPEGRDALARELIEATRREYAASHGSIMLGLAQAVRAANDVLYNFNASALPEARRIAGMTAVILRENELFIAQAGPGLTCLVRGTTLQRYPAESPWFDSNEDAVSEMMTARAFPTEGAVPLGMRRNYTPDQFHASLQIGDTVALATRTLAHLLSNEELIDTLAHRHPDEIITNLEELAGAADISLIAIQVVDVNASPADVETPITATPPTVPLPPSLPSEEFLPPLPRRPYTDEDGSVADEQAEALLTEPVDVDTSYMPPPPPVAETESAPARPRIQIDWARVRAGLLGITATAMALLAKVFSRVDWKNFSASIDRAISTISRALARALLSLLRSVLPGEPTEAKVSTKPPPMEAGWRILALLFPILMIAAGGWMWFNAKQEQQRARAAQVTQLITQANTSIDTGKTLVSSDKNAARAAFQKAIALTGQARAIDPTNKSITSVTYSAQDELDKLNGISVLLFLPSFATYSDPLAKPARIVAHYPDIFVLDRGTSRVYHYIVNDAGPSVTPTPGDGIILRSGDTATDKSGADHTVGDLIDLTWVDPGGRLIAVDQTGAFLEYDPSKNKWTAYPAGDSSKWSRVILATNYAGNLYLVDQGQNQILKYVAADGAWTSSVTYFAPGVNVDLTGVTDIAIDGDVWLSRADGSIMRFTAGKLVAFNIDGLDTPISNAVAVYTSEKINNLYIADAGNQRIVQVDKTTGRFARQFKPRGQDHDAFSSLKALAVDEQNKKFFFINGNQAYLATIPQ